MQGTQYRTLELDLLTTRKADPKARTFPASLSSEAPVERSWGIEILEHSPEAIDLERARKGLPLLLHHDRTRPIGMVENLQLAGDKLRAQVRFFSTAEGDDALQMATEGLRTLSVGYQVDKIEQVEARNGIAVFRVRRWTPMEASLVAIPADTTVGIGRSETLTLKGKRMEPAPGVNSEAERVKAIVALGANYEKYLQRNDVADAVERGISADQFRETIMSRMETRHTDASERYQAALPASELKGYSLARAIIASLTGDWTHAGLEREASRACEKFYGGRGAEGFFVPPSYWKRDFNIGTSSEAGNLMETTLRSDLFLDALRNEMVFGRLGVRFLPGLTGNVDIPRKATAGTLGMLTEIGSASETNPTTTKLTLSPKRIGGYVEYSKQALIQSALALEPMIRDDLLQGAAVKIEDQALNGPGTGANMLGIRSTTGIGTSTAGANGAALAWAHFVELEAACSNANASPNTLAGYISNTRVQAKAKTIQRGTNLTFIIDPDAAPAGNGMRRVNGHPIAFTNNIPNNLTKGTSTTICSAALFSSDWAMAVIGLFGAPDIVVDPYSLASTGQVRITLNQFVDFGLRQPAAFSKIEDLLAN